MGEAFKYLLPALLALFAWWLKVSREHKTVGRAIFAEMQALSDIVQARGYLKGLHDVATKLRVAGPFADPFPYPVSVGDHYNRVYVANLQNLGFLEEIEAGLVVRFYQLAESVVREVTEGGVLHKGTNDPAVFDENAWILQEALNVFKSIKELRDQRSKLFWMRRYWIAIS
ncbi:RidA family protein [Pseudomonas sp. W2Jun17]|uniref:RidA family protein n=1 Tax=Pseudomonas sp. W2Jun17 TaxID=1553460 RepID=UPI002005C3F5|nr:RidA family protein [Pseudomonas sp. W2Jun17]MCK3850630.1 hypothetical protein [Pseudomonas sp. W2Jun17]